MKQPTLTLKEIADKVNGELIGDPDKKITALIPLDEPSTEAIAYSSKKSLKGIAVEEYGALLISQTLNTTNHPTGNFIKVNDPYEALVDLIPFFTEPVMPSPGISSKAEISSTAQIGKNVFIGAFCVIGDNVCIGDNTCIHPHVVIYPRVIIGANCLIHSGAHLRENIVIGNNSVIQNGAVIGADGFGYVPDPKLGLRAIPQVGNVVLQDRVDVGANSCIDRGTLGSTRVGLGSKLDNLVQVGHNVKIGHHSVLCGLVGVAGSVTIGNQVVLGGNAGVADHIKIGDKARFAAKSGIIEDTLDAGDYGGYPAVPVKSYQRNQVIGKHLAQTIKELKEKLDKSDL